MPTPAEWLDVSLALCAIWYSFMPAHRVIHYRRGVALAMRYAGFLLLLAAITGWLLRTGRPEAQAPLPKVQHGE